MRLKTGGLAVRVIALWFMDRFNRPTQKLYFIGVTRSFFLKILSLALSTFVEKKILTTEKRTLADNHLRGCYGVTGGVGRARKLAMRRAPGLDDIGGESGRRRPEGACCEDSDLGSIRR
ncbi:jg24150 [Pararge aegeria aegeria]|uniref:Jg24150 protein n=1 Tax=Pararge aegeria aegeria TaxID=348720 RepID=A0A8S4QT16_9NEOP|nr:jg24150 [Pararge aegeria aegeria]